MSDNINFEYKNNEFDLIKYFLVLVKSANKIIICTLITLLITYAYYFFIDVVYNTKIDVSEKIYFSYSMNPNTLIALEKTKFQSTIFFDMQNEIFLNKGHFYDGYQTLDENIKLKIKPEVLYNSLIITNSKSNKTLLATYSFNSLLSAKHNRDIIKGLILNSQTIVVDKVIRAFDQLIIEKENEIDFKRLKHMDRLYRQKKLLEFDASKEEQLSLALVNKEIVNLRQNLSIAKKMGYDEPEFNYDKLSNQVQDNSSFVRILAEGVGDKSNSKYLLNKSNRYFFGSKILTRQIEILEDGVKQKTNFVDPVLANTILNLNQQKADVFIDDLLYLQYDLQLYKEAVFDLTKAYKESKDSSFITSFNLDRITVDKIGRSKTSTYIFAILFGIIIGCIYSILNYIIATRLSDENETELIKIVKPE